jgi:hypothetical protein
MARIKIILPRNKIIVNPKRPEIIAKDFFSAIYIELIVQNFISFPSTMHVLGLCILTK